MYFFIGVFLCCALDFLFFNSLVRILNTIGVIQQSCLTHFCQYVFGCFSPNTQNYSCISVRLSTAPIRCTRYPFAPLSSYRHCQKLLGNPWKQHKFLHCIFGVSPLSVLRLHYLYTASVVGVPFENPFELCRGFCIYFVSEV